MRGHCSLQCFYQTLAVWPSLLSWPIFCSHCSYLILLWTGGLASLLKKVFQSWTPEKRCLKRLGNLVQNVAQCAYSVNVDFSDRWIRMVMALCSIFRSPYGRRCCSDLFCSHCSCFILLWTGALAMIWVVGHWKTARQIESHWNLCNAGTNIFQWLSDCHWCQTYNGHTWNRCGALRSLSVFFWRYTGFFLSVKR